MRRARGIKEGSLEGDNT